MRRTLAAALAPVALAAVAAALLAGCGGDDSSDAVATTKTKTVATTTTPLTPAPAQGRSFVIYAKPTRAQFVNHSDDRARGDFTNPFDPDVLPTPPNANSAKKGARAGDNAFFNFKLFSDLNLTRPIGNANYSCTFNFAQEATCEANFSLNGGTMFAMGPATLAGSDIILPVTGGTGRYAGAHGQLNSRAAGNKNTQIIRFRLL
jgi:hypothetical protein